MNSEWHKEFPLMMQKLAEGKILFPEKSDIPLREIPVSGFSAVKNMQDIREIYEQFMNDPDRKLLISQKQKLMEISIPTVVVNSSTNQINYKYDEATQKQLDYLDAEIKIIEQGYFNKIGT